MSNTINSIGASLGMMMGMGRPQRPDSSKLAADLFSQIDTTGKGYIEKSDLESAFSQMSSSGSTSTADQLFSTLDSDSDGKVTQDELTAGIKKLSESLEGQFQSQRMNEAMGGMGGMGGMPPPPPPENDTGFTKEELQRQLDEVGSSDSERSSLISNIVQNFDAADKDGDGKVSFKEAMAYDQSTSSSSSTSSTSASASGSTDSTTSASISDAQLMLKILQLMHAYGNNASTTSSVTASA